MRTVFVLGCVTACYLGSGNDARASTYSGVINQKPAITQSVSGLRGKWVLYGRYVDRGRMRLAQRYLERLGYTTTVTASSRYYYLYYWR